jgi:hypothetical protein
MQHVAAMEYIFAWRHPFQVTHTIIGFDTIDVVHLYLTGMVWKKRFRHQTMNRKKYSLMVV